MIHVGFIFGGPRLLFADIFLWLIVVCVQKAFFCYNCDVGEGGRRLHFLM
jgi:hypothetical protein